MIKLRELRQKKGISLKELGKILGLAESSISLYETGKRQPDYDTLTKIADYFGVSVDYLFGRTDKHSIMEIISGDKIVKIPVLSKISTSLGGIEDQEIEGYESEELERVKNGKYFWLKIQGDNMSPLINHDDLVLVRQQTNVENGSLAVVVIDSLEGTVGRLNYGIDYIELISENPNYASQIFKNEENQKIWVVGQVVESKRKYLN